MKYKLAGRGGGFTLKGGVTKQNKRYMRAGVTAGGEEDAANESKESSEKNRKKIAGGDLDRWVYNASNETKETMKIFEKKLTGE